MDNIVSAIPAVNKNAPNELSSQEFQKMLSSWFEEKGVISDLRSHLKFQMINVLKNTDIGNKIVKNNLQTTSLSKQAVNLVVAEYLIQNQCHYSLSIFSSEVNLTNILPGNLSLFDSDHFKNKKFDIENVLNILELIGVPRNSEQCEELMNLYFQEDFNSILSCLINFVSKIASVSSEEKNQCIDVTEEENFIKYVAQIIVCTKLQPETCNEILSKIKVAFENEKKNIEKEYLKSLNKLKKDIAIKEQKINYLSGIQKLIKKKLIKTAEENRKLKVHVENLIFREKILNQNEICDKNRINKNEIQPKTPECLLKHCDNDCTKLSMSNENYKLENERLKEKYEEQKIQMKKLTSKFNELLSEFNMCQSKINLLNSRISEENVQIYYEYEKLPLKLPQTNLQRPHDVTTGSEVSSDSITEEILQEARLKLKQLEEESMEIDSKFKNLAIT